MDRPLALHEVTERNLQLQPGGARLTGAFGRRHLLSQNSPSAKIVKGSTVTARSVSEPVLDISALLSYNFWYSPRINSFLSYSHPFFLCNHNTQTEAATGYYMYNTYYIE